MGFDIEKRNASRRQKYAEDAEHRAKRRQQAEDWKAENRESYLAQQREAAALGRQQDPEKSRAAGRRWWSKNIEVAREKTRRWYREKNGREYSRKWHAANRIKDPVLYILRNAKNRAKVLGVEFDLVREDVIIPDICPVLGLTIVKGAKGFDPCSPSLDRVDGKKGYTKCNVQVISNRANILKRDGTLVEFKQLVAYMECYSRS